MPISPLIRCVRGAAAFLYGYVLVDQPRRTGIRPAATIPSALAKEGISPPLLPHCQLLYFHLIQFNAPQSHLVGQQQMSYLPWGKSFAIPGG